MLTVGKVDQHRSSTMNMQEGILSFGDNKGQGAEGAAGRWGRMQARSHGLTVQLFSNVFCYLLRNVLALDLSEAQRTKGIHSLAAPVCVPGNHQWWAPGLVRPRPQGRLLGGTSGSWSLLQGCGSTHAGLALASPGAWILLYPRGSCVSDLARFQVFVRSAWFVFNVCSPRLGAKF